MHIIPFPAPAWKPQPRTVVEIETELALLHRLLDSVPAENITGDSNTDAITAQIETIESFLTCEDVVALAEDEDWEEHITSAALTAAEWLFQGDEAPSVGWAADGGRYHSRPTGQLAYSIRGEECTSASSSRRDPSVRVSLRLQPASSSSAYQVTPATGVRAVVGSAQTTPLVPLAL